MRGRLELLYEMIPSDGLGLIDVGTDHGFIPIRLAESVYAGSIFASDINEGPLNTAIHAAKDAGVDQRIQFLLCDGLDLCPPDEIDCIVISGMGGDTICGILDRAEWLFDRPYRLILQPMTHADTLRYWLIHNDYNIVTEALALEGSRTYQMFAAVPGKSESLSDAEYLVGCMKTRRIGEPQTVIIDPELQRINKRLQGMNDSADVGNPTYGFYLNIKKELIEMKQRMMEN